MLKTKLHMDIESFEVDSLGAASVYLKGFRESVLDCFVFSIDDYI